MKTALFLVFLFLYAIPSQAVDFKAQVVPVLKQYCYKCHSEVEKKEKGKLVLDNLTRLGEKVGTGKLISPGEAEKSGFYTCLTEEKDSDDHMPPKKDPQPTEPQIELIKTWIAEGAKFDGVGAAPVPVAAPAAPVPAAAMTTWTSADGRTIQAKMLRLEGENVILERNDGGVFSVPLSKLSPASQAAARGGK